MVAVAHFLKPTKLKILFLVEWACFVLIQLIRRELVGIHQLLVAISPFLFFYFIACGLTQISLSRSYLSKGWKIIALGIIFAVLDQITKALIHQFIPYQASRPIIQGWLHLSHKHNLQGSWIVAEFNLVHLSPAILLIIIIPLVVSSIFFHRYYLHTQRESIWADLAFLGLFAGLLSWIFDMGWRGYILDFIQIPSIVIADLKDILIAVGLAAFFSEAIDNPEISWGWRGRRNKLRDLLRLCSNIIHFSINEIREEFEHLK